MQADLLFQIAGVGVLTTVVSAVLASSGRSELANLATVAGLYDRTGSPLNTP